MEELRTLCFDLQVDFDDLRGEGKTARARELIAYMDRHKRIKELVAEIVTQRPDVACPGESDGIAPPTSPRSRPSRRPPPSLTQHQRQQVDSQIACLRTFLQAEQWQQADEQTLKVLLTIAGREKNRWLRSQDIQKLHPLELQQIDDLWMEASDGHFGWSTQWYILQESVGERTRITGDDFRAFADHVGWRVANQWCATYSDLTFSLDAPVGHLPSLRFPGCEQPGTWLGAWENALTDFFEAHKRVLQHHRDG